jgi:hypothetical protein
VHQETGCPAKKDRGENNAAQETAGLADCNGKHFTNQNREEKTCPDGP